MPRRRTGAGLATLLLLVLATAACSVTTGNPTRDERRSTGERVLGDGLTLDLSDPPSRADLGLGDGRTSAVLQRDDRKPFDFSLTCADGHHLRTRGVVLVVTAATGTADPTGLTVRRDGLTLDDLETTLSGAVDDLGADRDRADAVLRQSRGATGGGSDVIRTLPTAVAPPDRLEVESVVTAREGRVSVNYLVAWGER